MTYPLALNRNNLLKKAALICILVFCITQVPWESHLLRHDTIAEAALEYWTLHGYQYGTQIIQNVGPLGFIGNPYLYTGFLETEKIIITLSLNIIYAVLVIALASKIPHHARAKNFLIFVALFTSPWIENPYIARLYLVLLCITHVVFTVEADLLILGLFPLLALLSLGKGTLLFATLFITAVASFHFIISKRFFIAVAAPLLYIASLVLFWLMCGQNFANLPRFLRSMLNLNSGYTAGYTESMAFFEPIYMTVIGSVSVLIALMLTMLRHAINWRDLTLPHVFSRLACLATELFLLLIVWKHSYVRADGHMMVLFHYLVISITLLLYLPPPYAGNAPASPAARYYIPLQSFYILAFFTCLVHILVLGGSLKFQLLCNAHFFIEHNRYTQDIAKGHNDTISDAALPATKALVSDNGIGYFGSRPLWVIFNDFNYKPMPKTIAFTAWDHESTEQDASFFRNSDTAPPYLLFHQVPFQWHLSGQDDPLTHLEILRHYDPVENTDIMAENKTNLLMQFRKTSDELLHKSLGVKQTVATGQWLEVPNNLLPVRMKLHIAIGSTASLLQTFYKAPDYSIEYLLENGITETRDLLPNIARDGVLIAPFLRYTQDYLYALHRPDYEAFLTGKDSPLHKIVKFRVFCHHLAFACSGRLRVEFETVEGLELGRINGKAPQLPQEFRLPTLQIN